MVSQKVTIKNPTGLHLRPAGNLCKEAMRFKCTITFSFREHSQRQERFERAQRLRPVRGCD